MREGIVGGSQTVATFGSATTADCGQERERLPDRQPRPVANVYRPLLPEANLGSTGLIGYKAGIAYRTVGMPCLRYIFAGLLAMAAPPLAATRPTQKQEFVEVRGARLYVQIFGSGRPVVFLHGGLHHFDNNFPKQRDALARSYTVIGIDQRGHGRSPDDARPFSYQEMAEDTAEVIRQLGFGAVDVVGHSDGANVALKLARSHPELVRRVVVGSANLRAGLPPDELQARQRWSDRQLTEFLAKFEQRLPPNFRADYQAVTPDGAGHWNVLLAKSYRLWLTPLVMDAPIWQRSRHRCW